jgi:predicted NodU family carbamoyl transferase
MLYLGINISHNSSIALYDTENKKINNFYREERYRKLNRWLPSEVDYNFLSILEKINKTPDLICYASFDRDEKLHGVSDDLIIEKIQKHLGNPPFFFNGDNHHIYHALCGFYFSKLEKAFCIVIDGGGSQSQLNNYQEIESIFLIDKNNIQTVRQSFSNYTYCEYLNPSFPFNAIPVTWKVCNGVVHTYLSYPLGGLNFKKGCVEVGLKSEEAGKLMGLASYGYSDKKYDLNYEHVHIAKKVQEEHFERTCYLIEECVDRNKTNNIILSGGCALNCTNNYRFAKKYLNINFFIDPIPSDAGTSIGACIYYDNYKK